ncbi:hypothetical protein HELRODRAFT_182068 [Helobdella robusta]|uniref:Uncharacterized protein n=1 Tax=Helobdella robusta TaxID=6412 RepID=T1FHP4_HELRO|nr:hypothetical protein HELRODRAFT_182068 [Helobdella robusta]ESN91887.1 hypothetical protein HELRODRAFT_182068 [Helobdella robusta]
MLSWLWPVAQHFWEHRLQFFIPLSTNFRQPPQQQNHPRLQHQQIHSQQTSPHPQKPDSSMPIKKRRKTLTELGRGTIFGTTVDDNIDLLNKVNTRINETKPLWSSDDSFNRRTFILQDGGNFVSNDDADNNSSSSSNNNSNNNNISINNNNINNNNINNHNNNNNNSINNNHNINNNINNNNTNNDMNRIALTRLKHSWMFARRARK